MKIQSKDSAFTDDVKPKIKHLPLPSPTPQPLAEELVRKMQFEQQQLFYIYNYRSICNELTSKSAYPHYSLPGRLKGEIDDLNSPFGPHPLQLPQQSTSVAETGIDLTRSTHPYRFPTAGRPPLTLAPSPLSEQYRHLHQMHYPPPPPQTYYGYGQHTTDLFYPPPYHQPYYSPLPYRRFGKPNEMYDTIPQPSPSAASTDSSMQSPTPQIPPSSVGTQLVSSMPPNSQPPPPPHMVDPYSPYYSHSFAASAAQCYPRSLQSPFIDPTQYPHSQCPCPMPTIPKNAHTGLHIGSSKSTDRSPEQINNFQTAFAYPPINSLTSTPSSISNGSIPSTSMIKKEQLWPHDLYFNDSRKQRFDDDYFIKEPFHDSFGSKLLEKPNSSISPARGSTGSVAKMPPMQSASDTILLKNSTISTVTTASASNIHSFGNNKMTSTTSSIPTATLTTTSTTQTTNNSRRARVGKSMAREIMLQSVQSTTPAKNDISEQPSTQMMMLMTTLNDQQTPVKQQIKMYDELDDFAMAKTKHFLTSTPKIKEENFKSECDDDCIIVAEKTNCEHRPMTNDNEILISDSSSCGASTKRKIESNDDDVIDLDATPSDDSSSASAKTNKRRKILDNFKNRNKKSPMNSYKSLIKPYEPITYLNNSEGEQRCVKQRTDDEIDESAKYSNVDENENGSVVYIDDTDSSVVEEMINTPTVEIVSKEVDNEKSTTLENAEKKEQGVAPSVTPKLFIADEFPQELTIDKEQFMSRLELTNDQFAKGYCSDNELLSSKQQRLKKLKTAEGRSLSESKRDSKTPIETSTTTITLIDDQPRLRDRSTSSSRSRERASKANAAKLLKVTARELSPEPLIKVDKKTTKKKTAKTTIKLKETRKNYMPARVTDNVVDDNDDDGDIDETMIDELLVNESIMNHNNNNNILIENNNKVHNISRSSTPTSKASAKSSKTSTSGKKAKSRGSKFGNKKRHRAKYVKEVKEIFIPRRSSAVPRWSNGWNWLGEPFQGQVFLNSDDHPVIRTRYPSMQHECGDTIRPGDCVLLRAGSKRNELPYVAKVSSLWENPEDGEMMMSLLWYYRPEHTEQGRQPTDCDDEVFASRHQDHNSVACIEDKCYVLTFNEYCRYRKTIRAIEEGIEELPSIVPALKQSTGREVPVNTNPELIFFCRRVYEFRLKRLIKNPS